MVSPIKDTPLNNPGETLAKEIDNFKDEKLMGYVIMPVMLIVFSAWEWYRWYFELQPTPLPLTIAAVFSVIYSIIRIRKLRLELESLRQGLAGEKAVGQYLEKLREIGAKVFHDIPAQGFNLDHVVIHASGIYVIETKTYSKPENGASTIKYDGETLQFSGGFVSSDQLVQVSAASKWLQNLLLESTGSKFSIQPVLVFPGWFIENTAKSKSKSKIWVLNPKALPAFIRNQNRELTDDKVHMVALHLSRYIRTYKS